MAKYIINLTCEKRLFSILCKIFTSRLKAVQNKRTNQVIIKKRTKMKRFHKFLIVKSVLNGTNCPPQ